ncbi:hypothetical protein ACH5RR_000017 [Cinchona calisaya]|uniref:NAC domain-containing protein n=1 Tax=Cinchona calisaya TaxID=153742 RepID=A0ABD3AZP0_9GENT
MQAEDDMSISVNGQSQVPPGFRFHPTEEELLQYYLRKKVAYEKIDLDVIQDVDLNKLEPWDIQEKCKIGSTPQNDWYFFSHKDKKYPTGTRTNRATAAGFWKATGRDKVIYSNSLRIGMRKTLVFYKGRAPHGQKSDWIMHEYRLDDNSNTTAHEPENVCHGIGEAALQEEGWVVCRIFKKKNHHKNIDSPLLLTSSCSIVTAESARGGRLRLGSNSDEEGTLEKILEYMGRATCMEETEAIFPTATNGTSSPYICDRYMKLPSLESPKSSATTTDAPVGQMNMNAVISTTGHHGLYSFTTYQSSETTGLSDWAALDRLVASQLNGQNETTKQLSSCFGDQDLQLHQQLHRSLSSSSTFNQVNNTRNGDNYDNECELWSFARSSADPLSHMPNVPV